VQIEEERKIDIEQPPESGASSAPGHSSPGAGLRYFGAPRSIDWHGLGIGEVRPIPSGYDMQFWACKRQALSYSLLSEKAKPQYVHGAVGVTIKQNKSQRDEPA